MSLSLGTSWGWVIITLHLVVWCYRSFHHLIITSKPFNHQQWSQDGKRVKGADQTTGDDDRRRKVGRFLSPLLLPVHLSSFPLTLLPALFPFTRLRLTHSHPIRSVRRERTKRVTDWNEDRSNGMQRERRFTGIWDEDSCRRNPRRRVK